MIKISIALKSYFPTFMEQKKNIFPYAKIGERIFVEEDFPVFHLFPLSLSYATPKYKNEKNTQRDISLIDFYIFHIFAHYIEEIRFMHVFFCAVYV